MTDPNTPPARSHLAREKHYVYTYDVLAAAGYERPHDLWYGANRLMEAFRVDPEAHAELNAKGFFSVEQKELQNWFMYHPPGPGDAERYTAIRDAAHEFAKKIVELCPPSADGTVAISKVREATFVANASIACGGR